jgi:subtilisin-like proprotein convertase family protein
MRAHLVVGGFLAKVPRLTPAKVVALLAAMLGAVVALGLAASAASAATFSNNSPITINDGSENCSGTPTTAPGKADPYPSRISVSGLGSSVRDVNVTLSGLSHTYPDDVGVLLVGPQGQKTILMTDVGSSNTSANPVSGVNLTFDDEASGALPDEGPLSSGTYQPTRGTQDADSCFAPESFPAPAPTGPYGSPSLSVFDGTNPNGTWKLFVIDDNIFDTGSIDGWSLDISAPDTRSPRVISTVPTDGARGVGPLANIKANFSEDMNASTINRDTVKLFKKGSTTEVGATVSYNPNLDRAVLNPNNPLKNGTTYRAVVTTAARDEAGNRLDQKPGVSGLQQKVWFFEVSN